MTKLIFLMRRKPGLSIEAFNDYWLNEHPKLLKRHAAKLKVRRYVQSHFVAPEAIGGFRPEWDVSEPFDGVAEVWLDSLDVLKSSRGNPEMDVIQAEILDDEKSFVDINRSLMYISEEHEIKLG
jgi:EthD domain